MLFPKHKENFLDEAMEILRVALLKKGIILSSLSGFEKPLLEIGKAYYKIKKEEEL